MSRTKVLIDTSDGRCEASVFRPNSDSGPWPAVLFFMDGIGIRPTLFEMGERLASHGYYVLLPDLFYRAGPYVSDLTIFGDEKKRQAWFEKYIPSASHDNVRKDTAAFLDFLAAQPDVRQPKVGTMGYCMGGGLSLAAAGNYPDRIAAAASYHSGRLATDAPDSPHLLAPRMKARVYIGEGTGDASFPEEQKKCLEDALTRAGVDHVIEMYDGACHGWVPPDTPVHNPAAAEHHWKTLFDLFDATLKRRSGPRPTDRLRRRRTRSEDGLSNAVFIHLGKQSRRRIKDLQKGKGRLATEVLVAVAELQANPATSKGPFVVILKQKQR